MSLYEENNKQQRHLAKSHLEKAELKGDIEIIVNRYFSKNKAVTAVMLPVHVDDIHAKSISNQFYNDCKRRLDDMAANVQEDEFEGYAVIKAEKLLRNLESLTRLRPVLRRYIRSVSLADNFSFDYRAQVAEQAAPAEKPVESEKDQIIKLARTVSLDKLYELFPTVPKGTVSATYSLVKMGAHDHDNRRKLTEADHRTIAKYLKEGKDRDWIAKKMKCNPFQVIASKARTSRKKNKRGKKQ